MESRVASDDGTNRLLARQVVCRAVAGLLMLGSLATPAAQAAPTALPAGYEEIEVSQTTEVDPRESSLLRAQCPAGKQVTGGGVRLITADGAPPSGNTPLRLVQNGPDTPRSWVGSYLNTSGEPREIRIEYVVNAICILENPGYQLHSQTVDLLFRGQSQVGSPIRCPRDTLLVGGGVTRPTPTNNADSIAVFDNAPHDDRTWVVGTLNWDRIPIPTSLSFTVSAICVTQQAAPAGYVVLVAPAVRLSVQPGATARTSAVCPPGTSRLGGGVQLLEADPSDFVPMIGLLSDSPRLSMSWESTYNNFGTTEVALRVRAGVICAS